MPGLPLAPAVALGLLVVVLLAAFCAACVVCTNVYEPRLHGKASALARIVAAEPCHALPFQLLAGNETPTLPLPVVVKPNGLTCCALGVVAAHDRATRDSRVAELRAHLGADGQGNNNNNNNTDLHGVLLQAYYAPLGGVEARLYGVRQGSQLQKGKGQVTAAWAWDPLVYTAVPAAPHAAVARADMAPALLHELNALVGAAFSDASALALDVRAPSLAALQAGDFVVLEVNGAFGVPHMWRGRTSALATAGAMAGDLLRWFGTRLVKGGANLLTGRVPLGRRIADEWAWAWASHAASTRVRTHMAPDDAPL